MRDNRPFPRLSSLLLILCSLTLGVTTGCKPAEEKVEKEPVTLLDRITLPSLNSEEKKPHFYFSTYAPGDELYEPVLAIQQGRAYDGMDKLKELSKQGDADAMYWQAIVSYQGSIFSGPSAAELFQRSAELGNPYSALMLDSRNYKCQERMISYCDEKWGDLAKRILINNKSSNSIEAKYLLRTLFNDESKSYEELAYESFNSKYPVPLYKQTNYYLELARAKIIHQKTPLDKKEIGTLKSIQMALANNTHIETTNKIAENELNLYSENEILSVIKQNLPHMGNNVLFSIKFLSSRRDASRDEHIWGAANARLADTYQPKLSGTNNNFEMYEYFMHKNSIEPFTPEEIGKIDLLAVELKKESKPVINITMFCPKLGHSCLNSYLKNMK